MASTTGKLKLVYDGLCPLCTRSVRWVQFFDRANRVEPVDFNNVDPGTVHPSLDHERCMEAMQLVTPDGDVYAGYYAFRKLTCRLPLLWPLAVLLAIPGVAFVGVRVYRFIAAHRPRAACPDGTCPRHTSTGDRPMVGQSK